MTSESAFIDTLRALATSPAARGLVDDAAVLEMGEGALVLTHDMIVEGVHYLPTDPPEDVAWKLVAVNLSDLAAKGARPLGVLLGYALGTSGWDQAFAKGLGTALHAFGIPLLGGDTVAMPEGAPRALLGPMVGHVTDRSARIWLQADRPGVFRGQCAEYCGASHALMALWIVALPDDELAARLSEVSKHKRIITYCLGVAPGQGVLPLRPAWWPETHAGAHR